MRGRTSSELKSLNAICEMSAAESATIEAEIAAEAASSPVKKVSEPSDHGDTNEEKPKNGTAKSPTKDEA